MIEGLGTSSKGRKIYLASITTMGSPILLFNMMLGTNPQEVKSFADTYQEDNPLRWINIICFHSVRDRILGISDVSGKDAIAPGQS